MNAHTVRAHESLPAGHGFKGTADAYRYNGHVQLLTQYGKGLLESTHLTVVRT